VFVSGTVAIISGSYVNVGSGIGVIAASGLYVITDSGQRVVLQSGTTVTIASGQFVNIGSSVSISGQAVFISGTVAVLSGTGVITSISGQAVFISGTVALVSGGYVNIGSGIGVMVQSGINVNVGSGIGVITSVSGNSVVIGPASVIRARAILYVTNVSGGVTLQSGGIVSMTLRSLDGDIYVGGNTGVEFPYIGYGMLMQQGDSMTMDIGNFNMVSVCAGVSGNRVSYVGQQ